MVTYFTLALALVMDGQFTGEGGTVPQYFSTYEECATHAYSIYENSEQASAFDINPANERQFAIIYPDQSAIAMECVEHNTI